MHDETHIYWFASHRRPDGTETYHGIQIPRGKAGYTANSSIQWFGRRELNRKYGDPANDPDVNVRIATQQARKDMEWTSIDQFDGIWPTAMLCDGRPVQIHADLWDFYKAIGYDYKKRRYTRL